MNNWLIFTQDQQQNIFNQAGETTGLPPFSIEKDAWVTLVLRMLFTSVLSDHIVFKGGTSLSKGYNLIERFSEDIDLAINREFFGFDGDLTKGEIRKLRRRSHAFSFNEVPEILKTQFEKNSINPDLYEITVPNTKISDQDPEVVHVNYKTVFNAEYYLPNRVLIEIGARSLNNPSEERIIESIIDANFKDAPFVEKPFMCRTIVPEKTFLEKLFLMHEEFHKPTEKIRDQRMSRHLYDIYKISQTEYGHRALNDIGLFNRICDHRASFTPVPGIAYNELTLNDLDFIPPIEFMEQYRLDYQEMQRSMICGKSPGFEELIEHLQNLFN